jgi:23S rRNA (uridine2552-2'-O)-methyltransferase
MSDPWYRRAKMEGYPSRAAYKLLYIQKKYNIIREGDVVVDLGSAPGGMLSIESELVGSQGAVLAVDTREIRVNANNITKLSLDILSPEAPKLIAKALDWRRCDVLISDASPNLSGIREVDAARQLELVLRVIEISDLVLRRGGNLLVKAFECEELVKVERGLRRGFNFYKRVKTPPSTWKHSSEAYLMGIEKVQEGIHNIVSADLQ